MLKYTKTQQGMLHFSGEKRVVEGQREGEIKEMRRRERGKVNRKWKQEK